MLAAPCYSPAKLAARLALEMVRLFGVALFGVALFGVVGADRAAAQATRFATADSRDDYVHWIELRDRTGKVIDPADADSPPYSPRETCGKCHDHAAIARGYHFHASPGERDAGRAGEPLIFPYRIADGRERIVPMALGSPDGTSYGSLAASCRGVTWGRRPTILK